MALLAFFISLDGAKTVAWVDLQVKVPLTGPTASKPSDIQILRVSLKYLHAACLPEGGSPTENFSWSGLARPLIVSFTLVFGSLNTKLITCKETFIVTLRENKTTTTTTSIHIKIP